MTVLTYLTLAAYLLLLVWMTIRIVRRGGADSFLRASGTVGWVGIGLSLFATGISSSNIVAQLSFAYLYGPLFLVAVPAIGLAFLIVHRLMLTAAPAVREARHFNSVVDFLAHRFGSDTASLFHLALVAVLFLLITLQFFVNTRLFVRLLGWSEPVAAVSVGTIVAAYTVAGGLRAGIVTDVFQGALMVAVLGMVLLVDLSPVTIELTTRNLADPAAWMAIFVINSAQILDLLVSPSFWQRYFAARDLAQLTKGFQFCLVLLTAFFVPMALIGMASQGSGTVTDPDLIFYDILEAAAPNWFLPILMVSLFSAFMSSLDSTVFALATQLGRYGWWVDASETTPSVDAGTLTREVWSVRRAVLVVLPLGVAASLLIVEGFLSFAFRLAALSSMLGLIVVLALLFDLSNRATRGSTIAGLLIYVGCWIGQLITVDAATILYVLVPVAVLMTGWKVISTLTARGGNGRV